jgi:hypothetical protein
LDTIIRDGCAHITKLEFLAYIQQIRTQAFKESTAKSAFKKTGIHPFNPQVVLQPIADRMPQHTPSPPHHQPSSSVFSTQSHYGMQKKMRDNILLFLDENPELNPDFSHAVAKSMDGFVINTAELVQTKRNLGRTQYAEREAKRRRSQKNYHLQYGGIMSVETGRFQVAQREDDELQKAIAIVEAAEIRKKQLYKRVSFEAAKKARKWRIDKVLLPAEVYETGRNCRLLRRF